MKILGIIAIVWLSLCALVLLVLHIKSHKFVKSIFINALLGLAAIVVINLTQKYTGVFVPLNWYTVGGSSVFGLPAVCGIILLQVLM
ncbi:MAG: pro-sigmaK processing inhibitor BofA family protein [Clostridia bacterium]|nr:pro-sigmaK processing inhibitor BofA family protein [Clostridia bacterium]